MAGDLNIREWATLEEVGEPAAGAEGREPEGAETAGQPVHRYGRLQILAGPADAAPRPDVEASTDLGAPPGGLTDVERLGLDALQLRESSGYALAKRNRPRAGEDWNMPDCTVTPPFEAAEGAARARAAAPTSAYLEGTVAVGIIVVQGPTDDLRFTDAELVKVVAEVQNGLGWYAATNPVAGISFAYDIQNVTLDVAADASAADLEGRWRDPTMAALGFSADFAGVTAYVEDLRTKFGTRWTFCGFFTKYPVRHFAYASIGGPRLVMDYRNDGWGPDNIDRVFAHETGHIFGCPDEYAASGCNCGGSWGRFGVANGNCANCAAGGGVSCLMKANDFAVCGYTPSHLGWSPHLAIRNFGHTAGGWRVERHPRMLADTTADGRADIVGFGDAGVYVSRAQADGRFETPQRVIDNFGHNAGGWRVDQHPRVVADVTGDGRGDVVGFGNAGVWVSRARADGRFEPLQLAVDNFGYTAGGWRVDQHPRFLADTTGDRRADVVGFGNAGVYVSRSNGDGTFAQPQLVVDNFGYTAGGWRVDQHPRFVVDTTGDGRADIVGFGNAGVYVSRVQPDGSFAAPQLVVDNFGYTAGGWRVDQHPRFVVDTTGDGRADIVGFGNAGVYISFAQADGSYSAPQLVVNNFGYHAGGWRVDRHPRLLADTTGDGRADIVGFGEAGVWISRALPDNTYEQPGLVVTNFGYTAGGWRVDQHPRFVVDVTGDGRADIVGFGNAGVYVARR
jgi:predicted transcriptional regulator